MISKILILFSLFFLSCSIFDEENTSQSKTDEMVLEYIESNIDESFKSKDNLSNYIKEKVSIMRSKEPFSRNDSLQLKFIPSGDSIVTLKEDSWVYYTRFYEVDCLSGAITLVNISTGTISLYGAYGCSNMTYMDDLDNFEAVFK